MELQLLADVALIGTPSVGKSTLINACSNAKAQVAAYHFTTLVPNLWIVHHQWYDFSMIDIPGLVEDSHEWKGLWFEFLRHILKAHVLCFLQDLSLYESGIRDTVILFEELRLYLCSHYEGHDEFGGTIDDVSFLMEEVNGRLHFKVFLHFGEDKRLFLDKMVVFVLNKYDLVMDDEIVGEYRDQFFAWLSSYFDQTFSFVAEEKMLEKNCFVLSAASSHGKKAWLDYLSYSLRSHDFMNETTLEYVEAESLSVAPLINVTEKMIPELIEWGFLEEDDAQFQQVWLLAHEEVQKLVYQTMWWSEQGEWHFWQLVDRLGFVAYAEEQWVKYGDIICVEPWNYSGIERKFIQWMV